MAMVTGPPLPRVISKYYSNYQETLGEDEKLATVSEDM